MTGQCPPDKEAGISQIHDLFSGRVSFRQEENALSSLIVMDSDTEGWAGIPHGGLGMGAVTETALSLVDSGLPHYPCEADFRLGGTGARVGDTFLVKVCREGGSLAGAIHVNSEPVPYMKSEIRFGGEVSAVSLPGFLEEALRWNEKRIKPLPYYRNCFVCGSERSLPGLKRTFHLFEAESGEKVVLARAGFDPGDDDSFFSFRRGKGVHPVAFMALLDETLGWGGFMLAGSGAVTVRISFRFFREVLPGEKIIFYGIGEKLRGKPGSRLFFWASGGAVVAGAGGCLEPVAAASGQWLVIPELTHQMHENLMPPELTRDAFSRAAKRSA